MEGYVEDPDNDAVLLGVRAEMSKLLEGSAPRRTSSEGRGWRRASQHKKADDPFRAVAWLSNAISDRHLAAITMSRFR